MGKSVVFMFSGQGSQYYQMGKEFYDTLPGFRQWMNRMDRIFQDLAGESVVDLLYDEKRKKSEPFDRLLYTHPAIFMVEYALAQTVITMGIEPDYVLGASLGEYAACALAGVMGWEETLSSLVKQAAVLNEYPGGMYAVVEDWRIYAQEAPFYRNAELAAVNYPGHFVVSGKEDGLAAVEAFVKKKGMIGLRLPVHCPFHSSCIEPATTRIMDILTKLEFRRPVTEVISSLRGERVNSFDSRYFWEVIRNPIRFQQGVESLSTMGNHTYIDLGPSGTLANFSKQLVPADRHIGIYSVLTPFGSNLRNLGKLTEQLVTG